MARGRSYESAAQRWAGVGPYYAMFPIEFSDRVVRRYTSVGDTVLDPFAGRGTAVFSAAHQGRRGVGIEINPVGWVYGKTKLRPATRTRVERRLRELGEAAADYDADARELPSFFKGCFSLQVRGFLLAARDQLDWKMSRVDRTVAALLLVYLHGKRGQALSNQMRQTKSMAPDYAVRWWRSRGLRPPQIDPSSSWSSGWIGAMRRVNRITLTARCTSRIARRFCHTSTVGSVVIEAPGCCSRHRRTSG